MKVLIASAEYPPLLGGVSTFCHSIAKGLQGRGHGVRVVTCVGASGRRVEDGIDVRRAASFLSRKVVKIAPLMAATFVAVKRERPDVLVCMKLTHEGVAAWVLKHVAGLPYVVVVHGSEILKHWQHMFGRWIITRLLESADAIVANSSYTRELLVRRGIRVPVHILNPALDLDRYDDPAPASDVIAGTDFRNKRVLLTVGQLTARKGHAAVMHVVRDLAPRYPDLVYVIAGGAGESRASLDALASRLQINDRVIFIGYADSASLLALYARCEIYAMPSRELVDDVEGFGITFLEANLFAKPVIGGVGGGTADAVIHGETGFLVDPASTDALRDTVISLLDSPELRARLGRAGRDRVRREFTIQHRARRLEEILCAAYGSSTAEPQTRGVYPTLL
jgi:phosphatidylinositol alpha-1,6-mannosyltransferase